MIKIVIIFLETKNKDFLKYKKSKLLITSNINS